MNTVDLVRDHCGRLEKQLQNEIERGAESRSTIFPEWAVGKVLLNAEVTKAARSALSFNASDGALIRSIYDAFSEAGWPRLVPAMTLDDDGKFIVILILHP